eukprot:2660282-Pleurochrysis_carterae.AAC.1
MAVTTLPLCAARHAHPRSDGCEPHMSCDSPSTGVYAVSSTLCNHVSLFLTSQELAEKCEHVYVKWKLLDE